MRTQRAAFTIAAKAVHGTFAGPAARMRMTMTTTANTATTTTTTSAKKPKAPPADSATPIGRISWLLLKTPDIAESGRFFADILGWQVGPQEMGGRTFNFFANSKGAIGHCQEVAGPSAFIGFVVVDDLQRAAKRVVAAGGSLTGPSNQLDGVGHTQAFVDSDGAALCLFQPESAASAAKVDGPGALHWMELNTPNVEKAIAFLSGVVGYGVQTMPMPGDMGDYHLLTRTHEGEERLLAGVAATTTPGQPATWVPYFDVADVVDTRARAIKLGATPLGEVFDVEGTGTMAILLDPRGATFAVMTPTT